MPTTITFLTDYAAIRAKMKSLLTTGLTQVSVLDVEPVGYTYPCVILGDIDYRNESQIATGNQPQSDLQAEVLIKSYMAKASSKTWEQTRAECFVTLKRVQDIIRGNPNLGGELGIFRATSGPYTLPTEVSAVYSIRVLWLITLLMKKTTIT